MPVLITLLKILQNPFVLFVKCLYAAVEEEAPARSFSIPSTLWEEEDEITVVWCCKVVKMHFLKLKGRLKGKCSSTPSNTLPLLMARSTSKGFNHTLNAVHPYSVQLLQLPNK